MKKNKVILLVVSFIIMSFCVPVKASSSWVEKDGNYYYCNQEDDTCVEKWQQIEGETYYFDPTTKIRAKDITTIDGKKYFFDIKTGKLMKGWINYNGLTYYADQETGELATNVTKIDNKSYFFGITTNKLMKGFIGYNGDKYYTNSSGILQSGMIKIGSDWYYFDASNQYKAVAGWYTDKSTNLKYYFNPTTKIRAKGITTIDGKKYFLGITKGKLMKGWINYNGLTYYADQETGELATNVTIVDNKPYFFGITTNKLMKGFIGYNGDKYYTNSSGILQSGMIKIGSDWYYFDASNQYKAVAGWYTDKSTNLKYYFNPTTKIAAKGVTLIDGKYYFFNTSNNNCEQQFGMIDNKNNSYYADPTTGVLAEGLTEINGQLYYFDPKTKIRAKGITKVNGKFYFFGIKKGFIQKNWIGTDDGNFYYGDPTTGELYTGWHEIDGKKYFFGLETKRLMKGWFTDPATKKVYYLSLKDGTPVSGWQEIDNYIYYFNNDGTYVTGNKNIDGMDYYFYSNGRMKSNFVTINGNTYYYYENGTKATGWRIIGKTKYFFNTSGVLLGKNVRKIIDISRHNGFIDWNKVKNESDIDGVILRINDARYALGTEDPELKHNIEALKLLNIPYGIYIYSYGSSYNDGKQYAEECLRVIRSYNMDPTLGIYLDLETDNINSKYTTQQFEDNARGFVETLAKNNSRYGSLAHIYTYKNWAETKLNTEYLRNHITWIAHWTDNKCGYNGSYNMWQYTNEGSIPGIIGRVDINVLY